MRFSGIDGVISIKLMIDWTNVSFGLKFIKTNVQYYHSSLYSKRGLGRKSKKYVHWILRLSELD